MSRFDAGHEDPVTVHKLHEGVSDGVTGPSDPDGLHHAGVSQLTDTQLPVERLKQRHRRPTVHISSGILFSHWSGSHPDVWKRWGEFRENAQKKKNANLSPLPFVIVLRLLAEKKSGATR